MKMKKWFKVFFLIFFVAVLGGGCAAFDVWKIAVDVSKGMDGLSKISKAMPSSSSRSTTVSTKDTIKKVKGRPDNVVKIDKATKSEVWEYYDIPEKGQVRYYVFYQDQIKGMGGRGIDEFGDNLREKYIDTVPVYSEFRQNTASAPAPELPPQTGAKTPTFSPSSLGGMTMGLH